MYDVSESRPVARTDVESEVSSNGYGDVSNLEFQFRSQFEKSYVQEDLQAEGLLEEGEGGSKICIAGQALEQDEEEIYSFRLFARQKGSELWNGEHHGMQRVALRSLSPASGEPGLVNPQRVEAYYFTGNTSTEQAEQYRQAAVSGEELLAGLSTRWPGFELPWRVTILKSDGQIAAGRPLEVVQNITRKRKRSGKKRRMAVRKRFAIVSAKKLALRRSQEEKEAAEREKRTRKNRERKVKKKQKEKLKKSQGPREVQNVG